MSPEEIVPQVVAPNLKEVDALQGVVAQIGAPREIVDRLIELSHTHGPELLTAVLGTIGILSINQGSSRYADVRQDMPDSEKNPIVRDASGKVLTGTVALSTVAFAAGNPLFAIPEVAAILTSLRPYLDSRFPAVRALSARFRADIGLACTATAMGVATAATYAQDGWDVLPPAGLSAISAAFALGGQKAYERLYRLLTISGGSAMIVGSAHAMAESMQQNNGVGTVMAGVFLALNGLFTRNEVREALRMKGNAPTQS